MGVLPCRSVLSAVTRAQKQYCNNNGALKAMIDSFKSVLHQGYEKCQSLLCTLSSNKLIDHKTLI